MYQECAQIVGFLLHYAKLVWYGSVFVHPSIWLWVGNAM